MVGCAVAVIVVVVVVVVVDSFLAYSPGSASITVTMGRQLTNTTRQTPSMRARRPCFFFFFFLNEHTQLSKCTKKRGQKKSGGPTPKRSAALQVLLTPTIHHRRRPTSSKQSSIIIIINCGWATESDEDEDEDCWLVRLVTTNQPANRSAMDGCWFVTLLDGRASNLSY